MGESNSKKNILKSTSIVSILSAVSLLFSFIQDAVFAYFYGASAKADAYNVAIVIPVTLFAIISASISTVIVPCYSETYYKQGQLSAKKFANSFITGIGLVTITMIALFELIATPILYCFAPGMANETREISVTIFRVILPTVFFTQLANVNIGILHSHKKFVLTSLASNFLNIGFVVTVLMLHNQYGIYAAALGTSIGTCLYYLYTVLLRRRFVKYKPSLDLKNEMLKKSMRMAIPVFIGVGVADIDKIIDKIVASFLKKGSISMLNYGAKITSAISSLFVVAITTVVYPDFARQRAKGDDKGFADVFNIAIGMVIIIIVPIIGGGIMLDKEIVKIIFGRGAFGMDKVIATAPLFSIYLIAVLFSAFREVCSRAFYSYGDSKTPMKNSIIGIGLNIIMNILLAPIFGAMGLAIATTISTIAISILLMKDIKKRNNEIEFNGMILLFIKSLLASIMMMLSVKVMHQLFKYNGIYDLENMMHTIAYIATTVFVGGIIYFIALYCLKTRELMYLLKFIRRRKRS